MTYRDDEEAARARVAALERENEQLRERVTEKQAAREHAKREAEARAKRKARAEAPKRTSQLVFGAVFVAAAVVMAFAVAAPQCEEQRRSAAIRRQNEHRARWTALSFYEPCVRDAEAILRRVAIGAADVRELETGIALGQLETHCLEHAERLAGDRGLSTEARSALAEWVSAARRLPRAGALLAAYYHHQDWREDDFAGAPALWDAFRPELDAWRASLAAVRRAALPAIRAAIGELAAAHADRHGRDAPWWRIQVGLAIWDLRAAAQAALEPEESGTPVDPGQLAAALRDPAAKVLAMARDAPASIREELKWSEEGLGALAAGSAPDPRDALQAALSKDLLRPSEPP